MDRLIFVLLCLFMACGLGTVVVLLSFFILDSLAVHTYECKESWYNKSRPVSCYLFKGASDDH